MPPGARPGLPAATVAAAVLAVAGLAAGGLVPSPARDGDRVRTVEPAAVTGTAGAAAAGTAVPVVVPPVGASRSTGRNVFTFAVTPVTAARLGASHRAGCPVAVADLRLVRVVHWTFDGRTRPGELVVHRSVARDVVQVFRALHAARFPLTRVVTAERYAADDDALMAANATSAYNCRRTTGGTSWSEHAYGTALDVNPVQNPYVRGTTVEPPAGRAYLDRGDVRPGMVVAGGPVVRAFAAVGWEWGGDFRSLKDYQHFSQSGR